MNSEQNRLYRQLKDEMFMQMGEEEMTVTHKIAMTTRFQQIVGGFFPESGTPIGDKNPKLERLLYDLEDVDTDSPIIIWARFTAEIEAIADRLKKEYDRRVVLFYGATPKPERRQIKKDFKEGKVGFFVANTQVGGTGLNLQRAFIHYYFSNSNNAEDRWQSEDRSHRGGQTEDCLYRDIYIKGTVDDTIKKGNEQKKGIAEFFKDHSLKNLV